MKRLVFILTVIVISLYAHPTGGYYAPFDYGKVDLRHFDTTVEFDSAVTFTDTIFVVSPALGDTGAIYFNPATGLEFQNLTGTNVHIKDHLIADGNIQVNTDARNFYSRGKWIFLDNDSDDDISGMSCSELDTIYYDTLSRHFIITASTVWKSGDTTYWIDATGVDTNWCYNDGAHLVFGGDNPFRFEGTVRILFGHLSGGQDIAEIQWSGHNLKMDFDADADTVYYYAHGTDGLLRYISATDQWEFLEDVEIHGDSLGIGIGTADSIWIYRGGGVANFKSTGGIYFWIGGNNPLRVGNGFVDFNNALRGQNDASDMTWDGEWLKMDFDGDDDISGMTFFGSTDSIYYDSLSGRLIITPIAQCKDSLYFVVGADTGWITIVNDTLRLNGNIPVKIGNSIIVDDDTTTISSCLRVISSTDTSSMDGYLHNALKAMSIDSITSPVVSSWTAFKFDTLVSAETFGSAIAFAPNNDSTKLHITQSGLYQYGGCIHWQNNSGQAQTVKMLSRITRRGTEVSCSQQEWEGDMGDGGESSFSFTGLMKVTTCDTLQLEYFVSNGNIDFISDANFSNELVTSLYLVKVR